MLFSPPRRPALFTPKYVFRKAFYSALSLSLSLNVSMSLSLEFTGREGERKRPETCKIHILCNYACNYIFIDTLYLNVTTCAIAFFVHRHVHVIPVVQDITKVHSLGVRFKTVLARVNSNLGNHVGGTRVCTTVQVVEHVLFGVPDAQSTVLLHTETSERSVPRADVPFCNIGA